MTENIDSITKGRRELAEKYKSQVTKKPNLLFGRK